MKEIEGVEYYLIKNSGILEGMGHEEYDSLYLMVGSYVDYDVESKQRLFDNMMTNYDIGKIEKGDRAAVHDWTFDMADDVFEKLGTETMMAKGIEESDRDKYRFVFRAFAKNDDSEDVSAIRFELEEDDSTTRTEETVFLVKEDEGESDEQT